MLQAQYEQAKLQLRHRLFFTRFVGLELHDAVPDAAIAISAAVRAL